jgi:hypothetical protein
MIALAAALLAQTRTGILCGLQGSGDATASPASAAWSFTARGLPASFEQFEAEVLCCAVTEQGSRTRPGRSDRPDRPGLLRLAVDDSAEVVERFGTCRLSDIRRELTNWVAALATGSAADLKRIEAQATAGLLRHAHMQCAYRLAPLAVPNARPIVVVQVQVLRSVGRKRFLRALWESEIAVGAASEQEFGSLYDELVQKIRARQISE